MKLWILRPINELSNWSPWYDKAFGFVVRAIDETTARIEASKQCGDEGAEAWVDKSLSSCEELNLIGPTEVILRDFASA